MSCKLYLEGRISVVWNVRKDMGISVVRNVVYYCDLVFQIAEKDVTGIGSIRRKHQMVSICSTSKANGP